MPKSLEIHDIIRILPFAEVFRTKLLELYPNKLDEDRRLALERYLWKAFYLYFDALYEENLQLMINDTKNNLPPDYHDQLLAKTHEQINQGVVTTKADAQIHVLRGELQKLITPS
ncbi:hypothetical protein KBB12_00055 [Candidatus Woesebacteria bacterium]|nr:hypothetical protein [Candidatus Woesebacteria bacterium]